MKAVFSERPLNKPYAKYSPPKNRAHRVKTYRSGKRSFPAILLLVLVVFGTFVFDKFNNGNWRPAASSDMANFDSRELDDQPAEISAQFTCAGKTRCAQMRSCEEAMFYLNNCPGSVTDGDGDGRPCEDQWCGH